MKLFVNNKGYCVVFKPPMVSVYDDKNPDNSFVHRLESFLSKKVFPVHRLDRDTCGLMIFAFSRERASDFIRIFREKKIVKKYLCIVQGEFPELLKVDKPLKDPNTGETQKASTHFKRLECVKKNNLLYSLLEVQTLTGRFHQIRRHLEGLEYSILGDSLYSQYAAKFGDRTLLSCFFLEFIDPMTKKKQLVKTSPSKDFIKILKTLGFKHRI